MQFELLEDHPLKDVSSPAEGASDGGSAAQPTKCGTTLLGRLGGTIDDV